jgi:hypothetical protein
MQRITGYVDASPNLALPDAGQTAVYRWVDASEVVKPRRDKARRYVEQAARDLGLGPIAIRWFRHVGTLPAPPNRIGVLYFGDQSPIRRTPAEAATGRVFAVEAESDGEIIAASAPSPTSSTWQPVVGLNKAIRGELLKAACRHEVRHLAQRHLPVPAGRWEDDAHLYAIAKAA